MKYQSRALDRNPFWACLTCSWMFLRHDKLKQLNFKLEKIIGIEKHAGKVRKGFGPVVVNHALSAHYRAIESQMQKAKVICSNSMMNVTSKDMTSKAHYCVCTW